MRSFFRWLQICQGTSSATITASEATISAQQMATMVSARVSAEGTTCMRPSMSSW